MDAISWGIGVLVAVVLLITVALLFVITRLFRKVEQGKALIISKTKKVDVTFTDNLRKHLAKKGFDPLMGARPMQRLIQDTIRRALADELLFGRLQDGGRLTVDLDDKDEVQLDIQPLPKKEGRAKPEAEEAATG